MEQHIKVALIVRAAMALSLPAILFFGSAWRFCLTAGTVYVVGRLLHSYGLTIGLFLLLYAVLAAICFYYLSTDGVRQRPKTKIKR